MAQVVVVLTLLAHALLHTLSCRCQIEALTGTRDIIQREQKQLTAELANLKAHLVSASHVRHSEPACVTRTMKLRLAAVCRVACPGHHSSSSSSQHHHHCNTCFQRIHCAKVFSQHDWKTSEAHLGSSAQSIDSSSRQRSPHRQQSTHCMQTAHSTHNAALLWWPLALHLC
jgi:hypothetical protein